MHREISAPSLGCTSNFPNPDEFDGGRKRFDNILNQIRERQKDECSNEDKNTKALYTKSQGPHKKELNNKGTSKRSKIKYGYPLQRKMRGNVHQNIHPDLSGLNTSEILHVGNRNADKTLNRQYSIMEDDLGDSSSIETPLHSKAVNTYSMSENDSKNGTKNKIL